MEILIVATAANPRLASLRQRFESSGFTVTVPAPGRATWPGAPLQQPSAVLLFEDRPSDALELMVRIRRHLGDARLPLVVVPAVLEWNIRSKYLAAGASQVCGPDESDERLVAEIQAAIEFGSEALRHSHLDLLQPFIAATIEAMEIMAGSKTRFVTVQRKSDARVPGEISSLIDLFGKVERLLAITFPLDTARQLTCRVLGGLIDEPSTPMIHDCLGELASIVAGQAKGRFVDTRFEFDISTPSIIHGKDHEIHFRADLPAYTITFASDVGTFVLQLCVRDREHSQ